VYHHALTPMLPDSITAMHITQYSSSSKAGGRPHSWTLPQSRVQPGLPAGWHVEARGLAPGRLYSLSAHPALSRHSYSLDASQCSPTPQALAPGSLWAVITASEPYEDMDLYAHLVAQVGLLCGGVGEGGVPRR
jgi:hypothetical protein